MTLRQISIYLSRINDRITQEIRLQAVLHKLPLPENGLAETAGKRKELTPEQDAKLKARLAAIKEQVQSRFKSGQ